MLKKLRDAVINTLRKQPVMLPQHSDDSIANVVAYELLERLHQFQQRKQPHESNQAMSNIEARIAQLQQDLIALGLKEDE